MRQQVIFLAIPWPSAGTRWWSELIGKDSAWLDSGAAYIFERNAGGAGNWGQVKKLTAEDPAADDFFGNSVAISGDTVVVGADGKDSAVSRMASPISLNGMPEGLGTGDR